MIVQHFSSEFSLHIQGKAEHTCVLYSNRTKFDLCPKPTATPIFRQHCTRDYYFPLCATKDKRPYFLRFQNWVKYTSTLNSLTKTFFILAQRPNEQVWKYIAPTATHLFHPKELKYTFNRKTSQNEDLGRKRVFLKHFK